MRKKTSGKKANILAAIGLVGLIFFLVYSTWLISKPQPLEVQGEVDATQVRVASKITGRVDSIAVHKGDKVKKGQLLYIIRSPEIDAKIKQAEAALKGAEAQNIKAINGAQQEDIDAAYNLYSKAQAALELAKKTFERINNLYKEGVIAEQKKDEAETNYKAALETANAAKAQWIKAKKGSRYEDKDAAMSLVLRAKGALDEIESYKNETHIYSPIDGEVADIIAETGELISAGYPVVTLVDLNDSWITFNLREDLLAKIKLGTTINANFPALNNKMVPLKIYYIHALGNFATWNATKTSGDFDMKTFEVHAKPLNSKNELRPGMSALVDWRKVN
jgi:HlyD family secretion protein